MKSRKNTVLILLLALLLTAFAAVNAQTPAQGEQKKSEACCAMETCCCNSDSCEMKAKDGKHDAKNHDGKADCCKMKNKAKTKQKAA